MGAMYSLGRFGIGGVRTPFSGFLERFNAVRIDGDAFGFCLEIFGHPGVLIEMV